MRDKLDRYYTPEPLAAALVATLEVPEGAFVFEPSAGGGAFVRPLLAAGALVECIDADPDAPIHPGARNLRGDFLGHYYHADYTIGNPPYKHAEEHTRHALKHSRHVAFLLRLAFLESGKRVAFWAGPGSCLRSVHVLAQRPSFTLDGRTDSAAYGWFWWDSEHTGPAAVVPGWSWK